MFAVKGWNVPSQVKTQTAPPPEAKSGAADAATSSNSKKRKRVTPEGPKEDSVKHGADDESHPEKNKADTKSRRNDSKKEDLQEPAPPTLPEQDDDKVVDADAHDAESKKKKRRRNKKKAKEDEEDAKAKDEAASSAVVKQITSSLPPPPPAPSNLTPLMSAMRQKLISSRFRVLNETLYTTKSADSASFFRENPSAFTEYHEGFARQVSSWPENPVNGFAALVVARGRVMSKGYTPGKLKGLDDEAIKLRTAADKISKSRAGAALGVAEPLPRDPKTRDTTIVDLGCGTGALARLLLPYRDSLRLAMHSFDLASPNELVTVADIRNLPLPEASVDVAVFSLALMGTNWIEFIEEAWRVLKWKGECWVADVNSRFAGQRGGKGKGGVVEHSVGARVKGDKKGLQSGNGQDGESAIEDEGFAEEEGAQRRDGGTDVSEFVAVLQRRGFTLVGEPDISNKMFARMRFIKALTPSRGKCARTKERKFGPPVKKFIDQNKPEDDISVEDEAKVLKPCVYKTR